MGTAHWGGGHMLAGRYMGLCRPTSISFHSHVGVTAGDYNGQS